ncbi:MAG: tyrosine-type recombinase/integrase [Massilibacteroides sp.]|nr:tyrosine-type recombinase/integrase [Massilibacteroides sp.]
MSKSYQFKSVLAPYMEEFLEVRRAENFGTNYKRRIFSEIDRFYCNENIQSAYITYDIIEKWKKSLLNQSASTMYQKYIGWNQLSKFMCMVGIKCYIPHLPPYRSVNKGFVPYIFTHEQISELFDMSDRLCFRMMNFGNGVFAVPCLLRMLYGTGLRISEALNIRNADLNIKEHYIHIIKTKNKTERIVVLSKTMSDAVNQYLFYRNKLKLYDVNQPTSNLFVKLDGNSISHATVYRWFKILVSEMRLVNSETGNTPRLHDLRHTFAVHSLEQMTRNGYDPYTVLPVLATYLGHNKIGSTEKYVRLTQEMYPDLVNEESLISGFIYPKTKKGGSDGNK